MPPLWALRARSHTNANLSFLSNNHKIDSKCYIQDTYNYNND